MPLTNLKTNNPPNYSTLWSSLMGSLNEGGTLFAFIKWFGQ